MNENEWTGPALEESCERDGCRGGTGVWTSQSLACNRLDAPPLRPYIYTWRTSRRRSDPLSVRLTREKAMEIVVGKTRERERDREGINNEIRMKSTRSEGISVMENYKEADKTSKHKRR